MIWRCTLQKISLMQYSNEFHFVRSEVFTAMSMKNTFFCLPGFLAYSLIRWRRQYVPKNRVYKLLPEHMPSHSRRGCSSNFISLSTWGGYKFTFYSASLQVNVMLMWTLLCSSQYLYFVTIFSQRKAYFHTVPGIFVNMNPINLPSKYNPQAISVIIIHFLETECQ
jgi:hypothetical protein